MSLKLGKHVRCCEVHITQASNGEYWLTSSPPRCVWSPSPRSPCRVDGRWSRIPAETILALFLASVHFNFGPLSYDLVPSSLNVLASHVAASEHQQLRKNMLYNPVGPDFKTRFWTVIYLALYQSPKCQDGRLGSLFMSAMLGAVISGPL